VALQALREVDHQQVHRPTREQRAGDGDALVDVDRGHDDEPLRPDAPGDGLDRVERPGEVQPGDDPAGPLGLGGEAQGEGRPAAREIAPESQAHAALQAARPEDRVERGKSGREDARRIRLG
jgi:hypothetical protein